MDTAELAPSVDSQHWYVAYTLPRHEKAVAHRLWIQKIASYVPLYTDERHWRNRRLKVELPLFPGYVFVRMALTDRVHVLSHPSVVRLLTANGEIAPIPDAEMQRLQACVATWKVRPFPFFVSGKRVRIKSGPFAGLEGTILRRHGKRKMIVTLDLIHSAMVLDLDPAQTQLAS